MSDADHRSSPLPETEDMVPTTPAGDEPVFTEDRESPQYESASVPEEHDERSEPGEEAFRPEVRTETEEQDTIDSADEWAEQEDTLAVIQAEIKQNAMLILETFEQKLKYDEFKEKQIENLHHELQEYKRDLLAKVSMPVLNGLIRLHDSLIKMVENLRQREEIEWTKDRLFEVLDGFADDLEILLEEHEVQLFVEPEDKFNPRRQTCRRGIETDDAALIGKIAARLQPGFQRHDQVLRNEKVAVYIKAKAEPQPNETLKTAE